MAYDNLMYSDDPVPIVVWQKNVDGTTTNRIRGISVYDPKTQIVTKISSWTSDDDDIPNTNEHFVELPSILNSSQKFPRSVDVKIGHSI